MSEQVQLQALPSWAAMMLSGVLALMPMFSRFIDPKLAGILTQVLQWILASKNADEAVVELSEQLKNLAPKA